MTGPMPEMPAFGIFAQAGVVMHETYTGFVGAGFTEEQALELIKTMITAMFLAAGGPQ